MLALGYENLVCSVQKVGNGGPVYKDPAYTGESFWDDSGKLKRRQLLDSYTQHTQKCLACSKVSLACCLEQHVSNGWHTKHYKWIVDCHRTGLHAQVHIMLPLQEFSVCSPLSKCPPSRKWFLTVYLRK